MERTESPVPAPVENDSAVKVEEAQPPAIDTPTTSTPAPAAQTPTQTPGPGPAPASVGSLATVNGVTKEGYNVMDSVVHRMSDYRTPDGHDVSALFQRMLNRRLIPDYFDVIKEPTAFSSIRAKILKKQYKSFKEFVRDFALISHNAQVYNRPSAPVYSDAIQLRENFKKEMQHLVEEKVITAEEAELPDLGEIPPVEDSPPPVPDEEEGEEEEDDEDEDEEDDESDEDRPKRKGVKRKIRRSSIGGGGGGAREAGTEPKEDPEHQKKRGRPPKVHTPMEARINNILKGLRKFKSPEGQLKIAPFERLPDKSAMPEYFQEIKNPLAMDLIKRQAKRKKYHTVDAVLKDLELMFENAKVFNEEGSAVYNDANFLQNEARNMAEAEKKRPDSDFASEDGRLPLKEILYKGEIWKVGDWIHLTNINDVTKPIVAQIYRTWRDGQGQDWINACWYYRPEQTVHRWDKHFFENEVVKTGQYRDHKIDEVVDRCFVMFFTRYFKGRPRGFPTDKEIYVCEARYNEHQHKLNKIKTWASCVPDEVREKDYEMDLFEPPRPMKKFPSPIKHLLREDATENDPLPKPTWGSRDAPPIVGAVHKLPRNENESPPPEPTPPPASPLPEPEPIRPPTSSRPRFDSQGDVSMSGTTPTAAPSPMLSQHSGQTGFAQSFPPTRPSASPAPLQHQTSYGSHSSASHVPVPPTPSYQPATTYNQYAASTPTTSHHANPLTTYQPHYQSNTMPRASAPVPASHGSHNNAYNPPRQVEVYTLPDSANAVIPADIRSQFHTDEYGRVIFYTAPPLDVNPIPENMQHLGHSLKYLAEKVRRKEELEKKRKAHAAELEAEAEERQKRMKADAEATKRFLLDAQVISIEAWCENMNKGTEELYRQLYGDNWKETGDVEMG